ncbi:MAG: hypothetical protein WA364_06930 [Candidatus Nitrosopolaris sp.]
MTSQRTDNKALSQHARRKDRGKNIVDYKDYITNLIQELLSNDPFI